jgi:hypothetical protein
MSLPLVFLAWAIIAFVAGITLYSFRGFSVSPPGGLKHAFASFTHWTVAIALGGIAGVLLVSALLVR